MWFHNWRRFFKYNDKTHFKIGIQPRHRQLHRRFAAIGAPGVPPLSDAACTRKKMRDTDRSGGTSGTCKTNRSIRTDKYRYRHFERTPRTTTPSPRRGGVVPFAKRDDCNTEATDSAISFARMSEIYLRQKKVSQLTRVTEENDDAGVAGRVRNRAGNQRVSPLGRTPAYGDTLNSAPRPSCRRPPPEPSVRRNSSSGSNPRTPRSGTISRDFMRRKTPAG